jgi:hypothetical protein
MYPTGANQLLSLEDVSGLVRFPLQQGLSLARELLALGLTMNCCGIEIYPTDGGLCSCQSVCIAAV